MAHLLLIEGNPALIPRQLRRAFPTPVNHVDVAHNGAHNDDLNDVVRQPSAAKRTPLLPEARARNRPRLLFSSGR
jgi:hypothetical protein